jgi:hypothetical protein
VTDLARLGNFKVQTGTDTRTELRQALPLLQHTNRSRPFPLHCSYDLTAYDQSFKALLPLLCDKQQHPSSNATEDQASEAILNPVSSSANPICL